MTWEFGLLLEPHITQILGRCVDPSAEAAAIAQACNDNVYEITAEGYDRLDQQTER